MNHVLFFHLESHVWLNVHISLKSVHPTAYHSSILMGHYLVNYGKTYIILFYVIFKIFYFALCKQMKSVHKINEKEFYSHKYRKNGSQFLNKRQTPKS